MPMTFVFLLIAAAAFYFGGTSTFGIAFTQVGSASLWFILAVQVICQSKKKSIVIDCAGVALLVFVGLLSASARASIYFPVSLDVWTSFTSAGLLYLFVANEATNERKVLLASSLAALAIVLAIAGILLELGEVAWLWTIPRNLYPGRLRATFINPNHAACFLGTGFCLLPALFIRYRRLALLWVAGGTFLFAAFLMTKSWGALLALALTASFATGMGFAVFNKSLRWGFLAAAGFLSVVMLALFVLPDLTEKSYSLWQRKNLYRAILELISSDPFPYFRNLKFFLLGAGPGTFSRIILPFYPQYDLTRFDHAHAEALEFFLESGLTGLLAFCSFVIVVFIRGAQVLKIEKAPAQRVLALSISSALLFFLLHSLVEFNFRIPANLMLFFTICALMPTRARSSQSDACFTKGAAILLGLLSCLVMTVSLRHLITENLLFSARLAAVTGRASDAASTFDIILMLDPERAAYEDARGQFELGRQRDQMNSPDEKLKGDFIQAQRAFSRAIALDPYEPEAYFRLGWTYAFSGDFDQAWRAFDQGLQRAPKLLTAYLEGARLALYEGDFDHAAEMLTSLHEKLERLPPQSRRNFFLDAIQQLLAGYRDLPVFKALISS